MKNKWILILLISFASNGFAQFKYEKEYRIQKRDVPEKAFAFVESMEFDSKVKWFKETGYDRISFEAKTKRDGRKYSIEFSADGIFEDIEIEIETSEIPEDTYNKITECLTAEYQQYSFEKIQVQYTGDPDQVLAFISSKAKSSEITVNYEIVIATRINKSFVRFELLFSHEGDFIRKSEIVLKNADNIIY